MHGLRGGESVKRNRSISEYRVGMCCLCRRQVWELGEWRDGMHGLRGGEGIKHDWSISEYRVGMCCL